VTYVDMVYRIIRLSGVPHPPPRLRLFGTAIGGVKCLPAQMGGMVQSDTDADMVELVVADGATITAPADAFEDALDGLPDSPVDEVAMVTDSVIISGDGDEDAFVRVMRPSQYADGECWLGKRSRLREKIEEARQQTFVEYLRENIFNGGDMELEESGDRVEFRSYHIGDDEIRRIVNDDRARLIRVYVIEYRDDDGVAVQVRDTEQ